MDQSLPTEDRMLDLLALRATEGISEDAQAELGDWADCGVLDEAAAVLAVGMAVDAGIEPMPSGVASAMQRIIDRGWDAFDDRAAAVQTDTEARTAPIGKIEPKPARQPVAIEDGRDRGMSILGIGGWLAAAACLAFAVVSFSPERAPTVTERLAAMEARPGIVRTAWAGLDDAGFSETPHQYDQQLTGEVVWDPETNEGYMVFEGLGENDPGEYQYQLWIFDAERRTGDLPQFGDGILSQRPVDGGVFDASSGRVVVPIDAKLAVGKAAIFAITVEPPGGVVVSDRDIVTVALVP